MPQSTNQPDPTFLLSATCPCLLRRSRCDHDVMACDGLDRSPYLPHPARRVSHCRGLLQKARSPSRHNPIGRHPASEGWLGLVPYYPRVRPAILSTGRQCFPCPTCPAFLGSKHSQSHGWGVECDAGVHAVISDVAEERRSGGAMIGTSTSRRQNEGSVCYGKNLCSQPDDPCSRE